MRVVIGQGADGLRAAAALASTGQAVLLLQQASSAHGLESPDLPEGTGQMRISAGARAQVETVLGPVVDAPSVSRAVVSSGDVVPLPMSHVDAIKLLQAEQRFDVGRSFLERRLRNSLIPFTGEGTEERTYRQWVERRMGGGAYRHVYADYARRRWSLAGDALSVAVARAHHNPHDEGDVTVVGGGPAAGLLAAVAVIEANGGEIRCDVAVSSLKVVDGRVSAVVVGRKKIPVDGEIWVACPHGVVAGWLGEALSSSAHVDAKALKVWDRVQVAFESGTALAADELHILSSPNAVWRVTQAYGAGLTVVFHLNLAPGDPGPTPSALLAQADAMGVTGLKPNTARVERLKGWVPLRAPMLQPRLRRLGIAFAQLGIVSVGPRGTFSSIDAGEGLVLALRFAGQEPPQQREGLRELVDPPVKDDDLNASFRDFLWR
jgi:hypothetical protein